MNLNETVKALEAKGVIVALNIGEHERCAIDSNCPLAIKLRKLIGEAGVTLPELLEGYESIKPADPISYEFPNFNGKITLNIGGKTVKLELEDVITGELKEHVAKKLKHIKNLETNARNFGRALYGNYQIHLQRAIQGQALPQLAFSIQELMKANCHITQETSGGHSYYVFLFPFKYSPEYMVQGNRRYSIKPSDRKTITRDVLFRFMVSKDGRFLQPDMIYPDKKGLDHYHGHGGGNCWGGVKLPLRWDGSLQNIVAIAKTMQGSLKTINMSSIANDHPTGMPDRHELFRRGTMIGEEGKLNESQPINPADRYEERMHETDQHGIAHIRTGWGRRE